MTERGFAPDYPPQVLEELAALQAHPPKTDPAAEDLQHLLWSSIDNDTSRDLDQVEYSAERSDGQTRVLVALRMWIGMFGRARRSINTPPGKRSPCTRGSGTSPCFRRQLSTEISSLLESEASACMVTEFVLDAGECATASCISSSRIYPAVVRNKAQLAYPSVGAWLGGKAETPPKVAASAELQAQLKMQSGIAQRLRAERYKQGALELESIETQAVVQQTESSCRRNQRTWLPS